MAALMMRVWIWHGCSHEPYCGLDALCGRPRHYLWLPWTRRLYRCRQMMKAEGCKGLYGWTIILVEAAPGSRGFLGVAKSASVRGVLAVCLGLLGFLLRCG